jgi:hypothetical protein
MTMGRANEHTGRLSLYEMLDYVAIYLHLFFFSFFDYLVASNMYS